MVLPDKQRYAVEDLVSIMELLRSGQGCPWDREQTHQSIRKNFIEETYEAVEAIDTNDSALLKEELGDVLLQVVFHAQIEKEKGRFSFGDVCDDICKKLISRHPHIFADAKAGTAEQVLGNWEAIKKEEKRQNTHTESLQSVPRSLPALMRAQKVQSRAAKVGFDYPGAEEAMKDLRSEVEEIEEALAINSRRAIQEELGDLLFSVVNVSRFAGVDAEEALTWSCNKFIDRFALLERLAAERGINIQKANIHVLNSLWKEVKNKE